MSLTIYAYLTSKSNGIIQFGRPCWIVYVKFGLFVEHIIPESICTHHNWPQGFRCTYTEKLLTLPPQLTTGQCLWGQRAVHRYCKSRFIVCSYVNPIWAQTSSACASWTHVIIAVIPPKW